MKVASYMRLTNYEESLNKNCILYIYSKDSSEILRQQLMLECFCNEWGLIPEKIYNDSGKNFLNDKKSLNSLLLENSNNDIIILDDTRLSRSIKDMLLINEMCKARNLRIFSINDREFIFDINNQKNINDMDL